MTYVPLEEQLAVEIFVRDLAVSLAFYRRVGFELLRAEERFAELRWPDGGSILMLEQLDGLPEAPAFPVANIPVMVPDVDAYRALAMEMGARIVTELKDRYYGLRDFTMDGPDGIALRFATLLPVQ